MDIKNMNYDEKYDLAKNPTTPEDVLRELAKDDYWGIRAEVAHHPSTPVDLLRDLAKDKEGRVRWYVANNPNTPEDALRDLAKDEDGKVRQNVAENPKASSKMLVMLFEYEKSLRKPSKYVIKALYANENLPTFAKRVIETLFGEMIT